ncbi:unnamed protein product [Phytophthora fragariaefolia]|uniref:Unnamed protein product n=1 Tax=Phytophthora fragariaefolia TaxID=1490495 RepID=A0A9W6Y2A1_9STRA|nr:unnamed protein product [Phytophthora fragariaefolia]
MTSEGVHEDTFGLTSQNDTPRPTHPEVAGSGRDFRADNVPHGRFQPKRSGQAYVIQDEASPDEEEDDREVRFQHVVEEVPNASSTVSPAAESAQPGSDSGKDGGQAQDILSTDFRIIENSGWRPPPNGAFRPAPRSPHFEDRNRTKFCERSNDFGHSTQSYWSDLKCGRCGRKEHLARLCRVRPCSFCKKFHEDQCGEWKKFQAVTTLARQQRVGLKTIPELCVLVYVGPELRSKSQDNHQCMTVISENEEYLSDLPRPEQLRLEKDCPDNNDRDDPPEFRLGPGQRYGWCEKQNSDETKKVAMAQTPSQVLQTAPGVRTRWSSDDYHCDYGSEYNSGSTSGLYYGTMVANIGEGVDVLLGMNFMYSAGVRLCAREGLVKLPDEETVLLAGRTAGHMGRGLDPT